MASAMGLHIVPPLANPQKKCHTVQSNFRRNSLKTKESGTHKVTHFFGLRGCLIRRAPVINPEVGRYIEQR